jgi:hypothetical protein
MTHEGLHTGLRAPMRFCDETRDELLSVLSRVGKREWTARRSPETWTIAELVDHLIRAEIGTSKMARRLIRGDFRGLTRPAEARLYDSNLDTYPYGRFPAPPGLVPQPLALEDAEECLRTVHRRFIEELSRFEGDDPDTLAAEDQDTGLWFTLAGWVKLQALHEGHHIQQIKALLATQ